MQAHPQPFFTTPPVAIGEIAGSSQEHKLLLDHLNPTADKAPREVAASIATYYRGAGDFAEDGMHLLP